MAGAREQGSDDSGPSPQNAVGAPIRELHPTMDARFVLIEIGKLSNQMETNTKAIDKLSEKVGTVSEKIKAAQTILIVLSIVITSLSGFAWWMVTTLWPYRSKLAAVFSGH